MSDHPEDERPRMDVEVVETSVSASAEAITRPVVGQEEPQRKGEVSVRTVVKIQCPCDEIVTLDSVQKRVICQGCGRRWSQ
jgi:hypothetical protein